MIALTLDPNSILNAGLLAICTWTLFEVVSQGKKLARLDQKIHDLSCNGKRNCPED